MRIRLLALAAAAGIGLTALPGQAATAPKPQITDPAGDANSLNGQGIVGGAPSQATPADASGADITSVLFQSTFKAVKKAGKTVQVPTGFTVTMTLSAAPTVPNVIYRVAAS